MDGDLIPVTQATFPSGQMFDAMSGRDVWAFVESRQKFADWMKDRLSAQLYIDGEDWVIRKNANNPSGGRPFIDYLMTLDMAKELALAEHNAKGQQLRRWIIARDKKLTEIEKKPSDLMSLMNDPAHLRELILGFSVEKERLEADVVKLEMVVSEQMPFVAALKKIAVASNGSMTITDASKCLKMNRNKLIDYMLEAKWAGRGKRGKLNAMKTHIDKGFLEVIWTTPRGQDPEQVSYPQIYVTAKGLAELAVIFAKRSGELPFDA